MLKNILARIRARLNKGATTSDVMASFRQTLDRLKEVKANQDAEAQRQQQAITEAQAAYKGAVAESAKAQATAAKLEALLADA